MSKRETILKSLLQDKLKKAQEKNSRYSLRALAKTLDVSPATLSRIISGKSNLSKNAANKLIAKLPLTNQEKEQLLSAEHDPWLEVIPKDEDLKDLINEWYYSPIVCLAETKAFQEDPHWIAQRLGISVDEAKKGLEALQRIGFLQRNQKGNLVPIDVAISTKDLKIDPHKSYLNKLELIQKNLKNHNELVRELSVLHSIVLGASPKKIAEAKKRILRFNRSLSKFLDAGEKSEVYLIFTQLIPISKIE